MQSLPNFVYNPISACALLLGVIHWRVKDFQPVRCYVHECRAHHSVWHREEVEALGLRLEVDMVPFL
ncbi:hypothetical protein AMJ40_00780 [candidate division TA06 bacterium DG_26]|uniref:Uncharacterized protein n=1 Tax=candidate division TA06 bacterium DG_26 TaxID=1703771 RepID=A0A0S7WM01_UNCT6|nr:MAG: hypothetical protein AMJ40_00780 [candidate division TA06 bacterium DG_26]